MASLRFGLIVAAAASAIPVLAAAQTADAPADPVTAAVLACRAVADNAARLACYDEATAAFAQAQTEGEVVVVNRAQMRETRERLFGIDIPNLNPFGRAERPEDEITERSFTIASVQRSGLGYYTVTMTDGSVWRQTAGSLNRSPREGEDAVVRRGTLGGLYMTVGRMRAVNVERIR